MQTHLNEQLREKALVREMYPAARTYAGVYEQDGLLAREAIVAHCIHMIEEEWRLLAENGASIAHCPTSNTLLGSGIMPVAEARRWGVPFALATDVGASPTTSLLAEARQFLLVHEGQATPAEAIWRITQAPAEILRMTDRFGTLREGGPASFAIVDLEPAETADETIRRMLGWREPPPEIATALASLRTGRAPLEAVELLTADFHAAARGVARVSQVIIAGAARFGAR